MLAVRRDVYARSEDATSSTRSELSVVKMFSLSALTCAKRLSHRTRSQSINMLRCVFTIMSEIDD